MKLDLLVIKTNSPKELADFYSLLGFQFDYHNHGNGPFHYAGYINETVFEIYPLPKNIEKCDNTLRLGFSVKKLDDLIEECRNKGIRIVKEPSLSEWGYQAIIEDPDGRKIELKDEEISIAKFLIEETFKITGRGLVFCGIIESGIISNGDEIAFELNGNKTTRRIIGIDVGLRKLPLEVTKVGLMIECKNQTEIDEFRQVITRQLAIVKNKKNTP